MEIKPIIFSNEMVQAILDGRKTQTRRVVKPKYSNTDIELRSGQIIEVQNDVPAPIKLENGFTRRFLRMTAEVKCPYGKVGNVLWVKENFTLLDYYEEAHTLHIMYDDAVCNLCELTTREWEKFIKWKQKEGKKSKLFMFASLSRIFLKNTNIRVERLQDISEGDAVAEGIKNIYQLDSDHEPEYENYMYDGKSVHWDILADNAIHSYQTLWQKINGPESWGANPWVWVVEFERCDKPENFLI